LRWVDDFPADKRNAAGIAAVLSTHRDSIPRVHNPGSVKPYRDNSPLCFPFIIEGMGCYCNQKREKYAHVDPQKEPLWTAALIPKFKAMAETPEAKKAFILTESALDFFKDK
jgi:hypothetical protein